MPVSVVDTMHLGSFFSLSKITFFLCKYVIFCSIFRSNEINCLYDLRESIKFSAVVDTFEMNSLVTSSVTTSFSI